MFGVSASMIRMLIDDPFNTGGAGYTLEQVSQMTPDQVMFRLCDKQMLKARKSERSKSVSTTAAAAYVDDEGKIKVKTKEGAISIPYSLGGKSVAQVLKERALAKKAVEKKKHGS